MKKRTFDIENRKLNESLHRLHKVGSEGSDFGMNNTSELLGGGFGLYSTVNTIKSIGPAKADYYRITFIRSGSAFYNLDTTSFKGVQNMTIFGLPGQVFSCKRPSKDFFAYYLLLSADFMADILSLEKNQNPFLFLSHEGLHWFKVNEQEGYEIDDIIRKINDEIKARKHFAMRVIQLYMQIILILAGRSYIFKKIPFRTSGKEAELLYSRYIKMVNEHFMTIHKVSEYADKLHVSADHLNKLVKSYSGKSAHQLKDEVILREAKVYILHSTLTIAEIAFKLGFRDPSHFTKFFKKLNGTTPLQYRYQPE